MVKIPKGRISDFLNACVKLDPEHIYLESSPASLAAPNWTVVARFGHQYTEVILDLLELSRELDMDFGAVNMQFAPVNIHPRAGAVETLQSFHERSLLGSNPEDPCWARAALMDEAKPAALAEPRNNDGRSTCWWCNGATRSAGEGMYDVCTVCGR